jgi:hypothetical protein
MIDVGYVIEVNFISRTAAQRHRHSHNATSGTEVATSLFPHPVLRKDAKMERTTMYGT